MPKDASINSRLQKSGRSGFVVINSIDGDGAGSVFVCVCSVCLTETLHRRLSEWFPELTWLNTHTDALMFGVQESEKGIRGGRE